MRSELGTVIASAPSAERVRRRNVLPLRRSSMEETVTGDLRKVVLKTGWSRIFVSSTWGTDLVAGVSSAWRREGVEAAAVAVAADWRKRRREVGMQGMLTETGCPSR